VLTLIVNSKRGRWDLDHLASTIFNCLYGFLLIFLAVFYSILLSFECGVSESIVNHRQMKSGHNLYRLNIQSTIKVTI